MYELDKFEFKNEGLFLFFYDELDEIKFVNKEIEL